MVRYTVITSEIVDRLLTAVPDDLRNSSSLEQSVKRWNRWIQALCRQVNRTCNCTTLNNMLTSTMLGVLLTQNSLHDHSSADRREQSLFLAPCLLLA